MQHQSCMRSFSEHITMPLVKWAANVFICFDISPLQQTVSSTPSLYWIFFSLKKKKKRKVTLTSEIRHVSFCHRHVSLCTKWSLPTSCSSCSPHVTQRWCLLISVLKKKLFHFWQHICCAKSTPWGSLRASLRLLIAHTRITVPEATFTPFDWDNCGERAVTVA